MKNTTEDLIIAIYLDSKHMHDISLSQTLMERVKEQLGSSKIVIIVDAELFERTGRDVDIKVLNPRLVSEEDYKEIQTLVDNINKKANELGLETVTLTITKE
jgi:hypothetical protein